MLIALCAEANSLGAIVVAFVDGIVSGLELWIACFSITAKIQVKPGRPLLRKYRSAGILRKIVNYGVELVPCLGLRAGLLRPLGSKGMAPDRERALFRRVATDLLFNSY